MIRIQNPQTSYSRTSRFNLLQGRKLLPAKVAVGLVTLVLLLPLAAALQKTEPVKYPPCSPEYYNQPCGPKSKEYDNGNYVCDYSEFKAELDTDGDGTLDCWDTDDDGDRLSDEVEMEYLFRTRSSALNRDQDGDGLGDGPDLQPLTPGGLVTVSLMLVSYDPSGEECDALDAADPYFSHVGISQLPIGAFDIAIPKGSSTTDPTGWHLDGHMDDRPNSSINFGGEVKVSANINAWSFNAWQVPSIKATAIMFDHDVGVDDPIDINPLPGNAMDLTRSLTEDFTDPLPIAGDSPCRAKIGVTFLEDVLGKVARAAVAHASTGEIIQMAHIRQVQP